MSIFVEVSTALRIHPGWLFKLAYDYAEVRMNARNMRELYQQYCEQDTKGDVIVLQEVPDLVEDYCIDLMAKRCNPIPYGQFQNARQEALLPAK